MYQALYRKYRPRTFSDVVGQSHITDTLRRQVQEGRLSHAYLFTGTRGTGKTTCAKILAKAVNCEHPVNGDPCNRCPSCLGLDSGAILDVLELDAASNNSVDNVRALREEAVYTPGSVKKRVYIIDEVHMLSTSAFNALLKILEEPPEHLMFILATTEVHKVLPTIRSRCQQFAFKRILPADIAARLTQVAGQEGIDLAPSGAELIARLADGGLRDALSLLDQCRTGEGTVDDRAVVAALGMAGNLETARLLTALAKGDTASALERLGRLYQAGKDIRTMLGELSALCRDLLIRKTAPQSGGALLTGGYDDATMRALSEGLTAPRLIQMLTVLQQTAGDLARSANQRTDAELCLIRLGDPGLDDSALGLSARVARLETMMAYPAPAPAGASVLEDLTDDPDAPPPWEEEPPPEPDAPPPWEEDRPAPAHQTTPRTTPPLAASTQTTVPSAPVATPIQTAASAAQATSTPTAAQPAQPAAPAARTKVVHSPTGRVTAPPQTTARTTPPPWEEDRPAPAVQTTPRTTPPLAASAQTTAPAAPAAASATSTPTTTPVQAAAPVTPPVQTSPTTPVQTPVQPAVPAASTSTTTSAPAAQVAAPAPAQGGGEDRDFWPALLPGLKPLLSPAVWPFVSNPAMSVGVLCGDVLTLEAKVGVTKSMIDKPEVLAVIAQAAQSRLGRPVRVAVTAPAPAAGDLEELLAMGRRLDGKG